MKRHLFISTALSAILILGASSLAVNAAEVSVGAAGVSTGSVGGDAASGSATVGGGSSVATAHFDANGNLIDLNVGQGTGPLVSAGQNGNPVSGTSATAANVNLSSLLEGIDVGGLPSGGGTGANGGGAGGGAIGVVAGLSAADRNIVKLRCGTVMKTPHAFNANVVQFCRLVAQM